jgi:hypothetical protein
MKSDCFCCTSCRLNEGIREAGIDSVEAEEFARCWRKEKGSTYMVGEPWLEHGEHEVGEGYELLGSFGQDRAFSMKWEDGGVGHLGINGEQARSYCTCG